VPQIAGSYFGGMFVYSASGCGCIGEEMEIYSDEGEGDGRLNSWLELDQNGNSITGSAEVDMTPSAADVIGQCGITGSVTAESLDLQTANCATESTHLQCADGRSRDLVLESVEWHGRAYSDGEIRSTDENAWSGTWNCFRAGTGETAGVLRLGGDFRYVPL
jgi:hypothetical protein